MRIVEKSRRKTYSRWYSKDVERVVFYVEDENGVQHFLYHQIEGDIPEYDKKEYENMFADRVEQYKKNGGEWIDDDYGRDSHLNALGPIGFIEHARKQGWTFEHFSTFSYCENGKCWMLHGNFVEVAAQFSYIIYTQELADKVRALIPDVKFVEDNAIIL